jgi:hypothetical protein
MFLYSLLGPAQHLLAHVDREDPRLPVRRGEHVADGHGGDPGSATDDEDPRGPGRDDQLDLPLGKGFEEMMFFLEQVEDQGAPADLLEATVSRNVFSRFPGCSCTPPRSTQDND